MVLIVIVASVISTRAGSSSHRGGYTHTFLQCWISVGVLVFMIVGGKVGGQINRRWNLFCIVLIM